MPGVGLVVAGTLIRGVVGLNHLLLLGPNNQGRFNPVTVKSIHHMRQAVSALLPTSASTRTSPCAAAFICSPISTLVVRGCPDERD